MFGELAALRKFILTTSSPEKKGKKPKKNWAGTHLFFPRQESAGQRENLIGCKGGGKRNYSHFQR